MFKMMIDTLDMEQIKVLYGVQENHLKYLEQQFQIEIAERGNELLIHTDDKELAIRIEKVIKQMIEMIKRGYDLTIADIQRLIQTKPEQEEVIPHKVIGRNAAGKSIYPKTKNQYAYCQALEKYDVVFGVGPAGTGKTYLAVVYAVLALKKNQVERIILTRPAVEAGENLGFLPGDLKEKVDPYLRPLYDALYDMIGYEYAQRLIEKNIIEIAPLAYMRGRTLNDAFVILDEAQNTTDSQMKMFLTRLGTSSKMVITGDITQIDLPKTQFSGLKTAIHVLKDINEIKFIYFDGGDVVRHPIVQKIIASYEKEGK